MHAQTALTTENCLAKKRSGTGTSPDGSVFRSFLVRARVGRGGL